nr:ParA/MinD ATPase like [uncultured bacterium]
MLSNATDPPQLTLAQKVPVTGAVIVSTPQDIALIDARKAVAMFEKVGVKILGLIENMSTHICSNCGHEEHIFGHGGAKKEAEKLGVPFLGEIPLDKIIRENSDQGVPVPAHIFEQIVLKLLLSF